MEEQFPRIDTKGRFAKNCFKRIRLFDSVRPRVVNCNQIRNNVTVLGRDIYILSLSSNRKFRSKKGLKLIDLLIRESVISKQISF